MIVITKRSLVVYVAFILVLFGFLIGLGMFFLQELPKDRGETFFFLSLLSFLAIGIGTTILGIHARNKKLHAIRLFISSPIQEQTMDTWVQALGDLGRHLLNHQRNVLDYNQQLSKKVQGMNSLLRFILRNFPEPLGIVSLNGKVLYGSQDFFTSLDTTPSDALGSELKAFIPGIQFLHVINKLERSTGSFQEKSGGRALQWYGITGKRGELEYVLVHLGSGKIEVVPESFEMQFVTTDNDQTKLQGLDSWTIKIKKSMQWMLGDRK